MQMGKVLSLERYAVWTSPSREADVKNARISTSTPSYIFRGWSLGERRYKYTKPLFYALVMFLKTWT
jgi:hypothetical protein